MLTRNPDRPEAAERATSADRLCGEDAFATDLCGEYAVIQAEIKRNIDSLSDSWRRWKRATRVIDLTSCTLVLLAALAALASPFMPGAHLPFMVPLALLVVAVWVRGSGSLVSVWDQQARAKACFYALTELQGRTSIRWKVIMHSWDSPMSAEQGSVAAKFLIKTHDRQVAIRADDHEVYSNLIDSRLKPMLKLLHLN